jgi:hypothetical protein
MLSEWQTAGQHQVNWNAGKQASGVYFYVIKGDEFQAVKTMLLLK